MKRFRTKKNKEEPVTAPSTPISMTAPPLPLLAPSQTQEKAGRWFGMGGKKPAEEEAKPEIDLTSALPSTDEFRTSLLMTGLSARFSMLREQDDPTTKVGKASDDSVLFPKRGSKHDFGLTLLGDIAEVESLRPFARKNSFGSDDAASMTGSIMNRSRPTDGNNLFGGRQKVYKLVEGKGGMSGRALYDDDVALSAFQKLRREQKQQRVEETGRSDDYDSEDDEDDTEPVEVIRVPSPTDFNRRRETSSTTSSTPSLARLSTAATSVTSNLAPSTLAPNKDSAGPSPVERSVARTRRLYEQGLNQELHDNQSSALNRLDTLSRRGFGGPAAPSTTNGSDRRGLLAKSSAPNLRTTLTPPAMTTPRPSPTERSFPASIREPLPGTMPLTPPICDIDELTFQPIVPEEKKSTGLGILRPHKLGLDTKNTAPATTAYSDRSTSFLDGPDSPDEPATRPTEVHPMFRDNSLPTPPTVVAMAPSPTEQVVDYGLPVATSPAHDSPTLGLTTGGLSGMVRQHLRADSNASSIYGPAGQAPDEEIPSGPTDAKSDDLTNGYEADGQRQSSEESTGGKDEFASQLADGARRVRERMTSYVEADSPTTGPIKQSDTTRDPQAPRSTFGLLKSKSSHGSLVERPRDNKTMKKLGLAAVTMTSSPTQDRPGTVEGSTPIRESPMEEAPQAEEDSVHAGLRAFRQAKREMQRLKEAETQQRHMERSPPNAAPPSVPPQSRDRRRPPVSYQRQSDESMSRSSSRAPSARERSGSETSGGGSRPPRLRQPMPVSAEGGAKKPPMARSPGLPGTDIRGSPHMPAQPYPGRFERSASSQNLHQAYRPYEHGQQNSPLGLTGPPPLGQSSVPSSPVGGRPPQYGPPPVPEGASRFDESMRRSVRKKDISGPTFIRTTSQVPTVSLEAGRSRSGSRSRSTSIASNAGESVPPLPPINPKRRVLGALGGRRDDDAASNTSLPLQSPLSDNSRDSRWADSPSTEGPGGMF